MYRRRGTEVEVLLVHPGGPFWAKKDEGAWSIPKGEYLDGEDPLQAARREFTEETGFTAEGQFVALGTVKQAGGKLVSAWAVEGDCDPRQIKSNMCEITWPPRSKRLISIPEVDRAEWFSIAAASRRILPSQQPFLQMLVRSLSAGS